MRVQIEPDPVGFNPCVLMVVTVATVQVTNNTFISCHLPG